MIVDRIRELAIKNNTNIAEIERKLNLGKATIGRWDKNIPSADKLYKVANLLSVSLEYLLTGETTKIDISEEEQILLSSFKKLNEVYKHKILGRIETYLDEHLSDDISKENIIKFEDIATKQNRKVNDNNNDNDKKLQSNVTALNDYKTIRNSEARKYKYNTVKYGKISAGDGIDVYEDKEIIRSPVECDFALIVDGNSMEPMFSDGQTIYLKQQNYIDYSGQILAIQIEGDFNYEVYLKKVYFIDDMVRLLSLNTDYEDKYFKIDKVSIIGRVIQ